VSLVVEIEAVADQLLDFDFGRAVEAALVRGAVAAVAALAAIIGATVASLMSSTLM
jgi:hypothetical protein